MSCYNAPPPLINFLAVSLNKTHHVVCSVVLFDFRTFAREDNVKSHCSFFLNAGIRERDKDRDVDRDIEIIAGLSC